LTDLVFGKACLPDYDALPEAAREKYESIVNGLGINDAGQSLDDIMNSWQIYVFALGLALIVT
jgi:cellobiose phosphorylase